MKSIQAACALVILVLAYGCATTQPIADGERRTIRKVTVDKNVVIPEQPVVIGPSASTGSLLFGPLAIAAAMTGNADSVALKEFMDKNKIDIREIVHREFVGNLAAGRVAVVDEGGDANFELTVESYGLGPAFNLSPVNKPLRPSLRLQGKLSSADGKLLWQNVDYITNLSDMPAHTMDKYLADPALTRDAFKTAAQLTIDSLLNNLSGQASFAMQPPALQSAERQAGARQALNAAANSSTPASSTTPGSALPQIGATWNYSIEDRLYSAKHAFTVRLAAANAFMFNELYQVEGGTNGAAPLDAEAISFTERPFGDGRRLIELAPYLIAVGPSSIRAPAGYPAGGSSEPFKVRVLKVSEDNVVVPAGSFKALRVEVSGERSASGFVGHSNPQWNALGVTRFSYTVWYAKDTHRYVMVRHQQWNASGSEVSNELVQLLRYSPK